MSTLRLSSSERRLLLSVFDILVLNLALLIALVWRLNYTFSWRTFREAPHYFLILTVLWFVWASLFDSYERPRTADASQSAWNAGGAALLTALSYLLIPYYSPAFPTSRLSAFIFVGLVTCSVSLWRVFYAAVLSQPTFQQRLLIVGAGRSGAELARALAGTPQMGNPYAGSGLQVVGFVDDDPEKAGTEIEGVPVIGDRNNLRQLVQDYEVDILALAVTHTPEIQPGLFQALLDCRALGVRLEPMTNLFERFTGRVPVEHAGLNLHVVMPLSTSPMQRVFWVVKRLIDVMSALIGLAVLGFAVPWVALVNALSCPGPLFYRQVRVGQGGKLFNVIKFRSMIPNAEEDSGAVWAVENDSRVTHMGRIMRATRIDELPQFLNVLKGEMSLVGPRPERPEFVSQLVKQVPFYQARYAVKPGITGWAQVRYRYGSSVNDALIKLQYDLYYIKHQGVYLELSILAKTAAVILGLKGR